MGGDFVPVPIPSIYTAPPGRNAHVDFRLSFPIRPAALVSEKRQYRAAIDARQSRVFRPSIAHDAPSTSGKKRISTDYHYDAPTGRRRVLTAPTFSPAPDAIARLIRPNTPNARYNSLMVNTVAVTLRDPQHVFIIFFLFFSRYALHHTRRVLHGPVNIGRISVRTRARVLYYRVRTQKKRNRKRNRTLHSACVIEFNYFGRPNL